MSRELSLRSAPAGSLVAAFVLLVLMPGGSPLAPPWASLLVAPSEADHVSIGRGEGSYRAPDGADGLGGVGVEDDGAPRDPWICVKEDCLCRGDVWLAVGGPDGVRLRRPDASDDAARSRLRSGFHPPLVGTRVWIPGPDARVVGAASERSSVLAIVTLRSEDDDENAVEPELALERRR